MSSPRLLLLARIVKKPVLPATGIKPTYVIVGLGNPGRHEHTRHNVGFEVIDRLAATWRIAVKSRRALCRIGVGEVEGHAVLLAKPQTFMNESGRALQSLRSIWDVPLTDYLVVCNDIHLPLGRLRLRRTGSHGGQNGLRSIIHSLGTPDFPRLRLGISDGEVSPDRWVEFVLSPFNSEEEALIDSAVGRAADTIALLVRDGVEAAMNLCNG